MNCPESRDAILLEVDGLLAASARERLGRHLGRCAACRDYAAEVRGVLAALAASTPALPPGLGRQLAQTAAETPSAVRVSPGAWLRHWGVAAALLLAAAVVTLALLDRFAPPPTNPPATDLAALSIERIAADLAALAGDIERQHEPLVLLSEDRATAVQSAPAVAPSVARTAFDDELLRIGRQIEALGQPIFAELNPWEGDNG
jgi:anti-sigma factor RsiW